MGYGEKYGRYIRGLAGRTGRVRVRSVLRSGDEHPSLVIDLDSGLWYDFGLGEGGNFRDFERRMGNVGVVGEFSGVVGVRLERRIDRGWLESRYEWWDELGRRGIDEGVFRSCGGYVYRDGRDWVVVLDYIGHGELVRWKRIRYRDGVKVGIDSSGGVLLYPGFGLQGGRGVVLCEGELDCLVLRSKGWRAVTSSGGALSFKAEWLWMFEGKRVFLMYDDDEAGRRGMERVCGVLGDRVVGCVYWGYGNGYDVSEYVRGGGNLASILGYLGEEYRLW